MIAGILSIQFSVRNEVLNSSVSVTDDDPGVEVETETSISKADPLSTSEVCVLTSELEADTSIEISLEGAKVIHLFFSVVVVVGSWVVVVA